jgi:hypothetical protein
MKRSLLVAIGFVLALACLPVDGQCKDAQLQANVEALYAKADQALKNKDIQGYLALLTNDYEHVFVGINRDKTQIILKDLFDGYKELRVERAFLEITRFGKWIKVVCSNKVEGNTRREGWSIVLQGVDIDFLIQEGNSLKIARSTQTDKHRLANVSGRIYRDKETGFSFTAPKGWAILPTTAHPNIQGGVFVLTPDGSSAAMIGYVKMPNISARQAVEGDESLGKIMSKPGTYKLIKSGAIRVNGWEGFEIESEFFIPNDKERHRRRVYYNSNGLLYVLCFDGMPFQQWDKVKDGFQSILDSIR